jgi:hypothetical protein
MKKTRRTKLSLHRDTLRALTEGGLDHVFGGMIDQSVRACPPPNTAGSAAMMCNSADPFQCNSAWVCYPPS